jgi:hypothetical protein
MNMGKETIITKGCKLLLDAFQFVGISSRNGIPNDRGVLIIINNNNNNKQIIIKSTSLPKQNKSNKRLLTP